MSAISPMAASRQTILRRERHGGSVSHADYFAWLEEIGGGWLGWTEEETNNASMPYIINCYVGRLRMLNWKSGDTGPKVTQTKKPDMIAALMLLAKQEGVKR
jgi:hypothetical protein